MANWQDARGDDHSDDAAQERKREIVHDPEDWRKIGDYYESECPPWLPYPFHEFPEPRSDAKYLDVAEQLEGELREHGIDPDDYFAAWEAVHEAQVAFDAAVAEADRLEEQLLGLPSGTMEMRRLEYERSRYR